MQCTNLPAPFLLFFPDLGPAGGKVHGRVLQPHELVKEYFKGMGAAAGGGAPEDGMWACASCSFHNMDAKGACDVCGQGRPAIALDDAVLEKQWEDLRGKFAGTNGGKYVAVCDVSGSMHGDPIIASVALGILLAEVAHPAFKDHFITFSEVPMWHNLPAGGSLREKVASARAAPWGQGTDLQACVDLILQTCVEQQVAPEEMPQAMVVLSDMQFDPTRGGAQRPGGAPPGGAPQGGAPQGGQRWESAYMGLKKAFEEAGYDRAPHIIFWNLRGGVDEAGAAFPASAMQEGVTMISGFSANLVSAQLPIGWCIVRACVCALYVHIATRVFMMLYKVCCIITYCTHIQDRYVSFSHSTL